MDVVRVFTACGLVLAVAVSIAAIDRWRESRLVTRPLPTPQVKPAVPRRGVSGSAARVAARRRDRAA